jgi:hypothetical protein
MLADGMERDGMERDERVEAGEGFDSVSIFLKATSG